MKDNKLHSFRRTPDQPFTENLLERLNQLPAASRPTVQPRPTRRRPLAWALASIVLLLALTAMVPGVRARFEDVIKQVGSQTIFMTEDFPMKSEPRIIPDEIMPLEQARERIDFEFNLPTWVPDDFVLQSEEVHFSTVIDGLVIQWLGDGRGRGLTLVVSEVLPGVPDIVGPDSLTEITLNGEPAALIRGGWFSDSKEWKDYGLRSIRLPLNGIQYDLSVGGEEYGAITDEELIKIAESIAPIPAPEEENSVRP